MTFESDSDEAGKMFVGGLNWETTRENLESYFCRFGEIVDSVVMKHSETGRSRGFGFITFKDPDLVPVVLSAGPHMLDGKVIDPKACMKRSAQRDRKPEALKAFLGGLPLDITNEDLVQAFSRFGTVSNINIMYDQEKQKPRGFGFLTFDSQDALQRACREHYITVNGKQIECKAAQPRDSRRFQPSQPYGARRGPPGMPPAQNWSSMPPNAKPPGPPPPAVNYAGGNSAPGPYPPPGYNAYQQPAQPSYNYQGSYNYQAAYNTPTPTAGYESSYSTPAAAAAPQPPAAPYASSTYAADSYGQSDSQYGPTKGRNPAGNAYGASGYTGTTDYKPASGGGYGSQNSAQQAAYHPYKR